MRDGGYSAYTSSTSGALTLEMLQRVCNDCVKSAETPRPRHIIVSPRMIEVAGILGQEDLHKHLDALARAAGRTFLGASIVPHPDLRAAGRWALGGGVYPYPRPKVTIPDPSDFTPRRYIDDPVDPIPFEETWAAVARSEIPFWRSQV